jgi:hypothetical protein
LKEELALLVERKREAEKAALADQEMGTEKKRVRKTWW